jgi:hypothetical protein
MMRLACHRIDVLQVFCATRTTSPLMRKLLADNLTRSNPWQEISINRVGPC